MNVARPTIVAGGKPERLAAAMVIRHGRADTRELEAVIRKQSEDWSSLVDHVRHELALTEHDDAGIAEEQAAYLLGIAVGRQLVPTGGPR